MCEEEDGEDPAEQEYDPTADPEDPNSTDYADYVEQDPEYVDTVFNKSYLSYPAFTSVQSATVQVSRDTQLVPRIGRLNVYESPILSCSHNTLTVHIVLDSGATCSLMSLNMTKKLGLQVHKTIHKAVQVDGQSPLKVVGEVHTQLSRGNIKLNFSGLAITDMAADILGGTNFLIENDISYRMAKGTIQIGPSCTVMSTSPTVLQLDKIETKQRLLKTSSALSLTPGDYTSLPLPNNFPPQCLVLIQPNLQQAPPFFKSNIVQAENGQVTVQNESKDVVTFRKNSQPITVQRVSESPLPSLPAPTEEPKVTFLTPQDILTKVSFDTANNLTRSQKVPFIETVKKYVKIFQPDLPGYNGSYGPVFADFTFASSARPGSHKIHTPSYGPHGQVLLHQKFSKLKAKGVLIDPLANNITPSLTHNSWLVKKPSSAHIPWDQCKESDVRLVVGFDRMNKFLKDPPGKVTKVEQIYASMASWKVMGELDFSDFYFQLKFRNQTPADKVKLSYMCV